ncbi:hypothetical protein V5S96_03970 [Corynebacterium mastitidis]|uniref:Secreted protein n=1 Tax=Corynebacterium mastitidis TaxID=161890 RepID=A0ABU8NX24_9CORY
MRSKIISTLAATALTVGVIAGAPAASAAQKVVPGKVGESCSIEGQRGQSLKITSSSFEVEGTATVANYNDENLPLTQTLKEGKTKSWNVGGSIDFDLLKLFHVTFNAGYQSSQTWEVGQTLGPYPVKPGYTGVLEYGFLNQTFEGTHIRCSGGTWVNEGRPFHGTIPKERHVKVSMRSNDA